MNDIQMNEKIYSNAAKKLELYRSELDYAEKKVAQSKQDYIKSIIHTAKCGKKAVQEKNSSFIKTALLAGVGLAVITVSILGVMGVLVVFVLGFIVFVTSMDNDQAKEKRKEEQKAFFDKYTAFIIENENEWMGNDADNSSSIDKDWFCQECGAANKASYVFCGKCGKKKN